MLNKKKVGSLISAAAFVTACGVNTPDGVVEEALDTLQAGDTSDVMPCTTQVVGSRIVPIQTLELELNGSGFVEVRENVVFHGPVQLADFPDNAVGAIVLARPEFGEVLPDSVTLEVDGPVHVTRGPIAIDWDRGQRIWHADYNGVNPEWRIEGEPHSRFVFALLRCAEHAGEPSVGVSASGLEAGDPSDPMPEGCGSIVPGTVETVTPDSQGFVRFYDLLPEDPYNVPYINEEPADSIGIRVGAIDGTQVLPVAVTLYGRLYSPPGSYELMRARTVVAVQGQRFWFTTADYWFQPQWLFETGGQQFSLSTFRCAGVQ